MHWALPEPRQNTSIRLINETDLLKRSERPNLSWGYQTVASSRTSSIEMTVKWITDPNSGTAD